ncbi:MAG: ABC transporter substrate-binding protein [Myxococcales bacterium]|nr:ABC transporter substrate-binding protein [Myxococcales bacterium]
MTLGAAVSDIVSALGAADLVVGADSTSSDVFRERPRPDVGFFRQISAEGVLSLRPSLVIALDEAGPPPAMEQLRAARLEIVRVPTSHTVESAKDRIRIIARALDRSAGGDRLIQEIESDLKKVAVPAKRPSVLFIYARGAGTLLVAGRDTSAHGMIELAGGRPAVEAFEGYKPLSPEVVLQSAPDVLLLTEGGLASLGGA